MIRNLQGIHETVDYKADTQICLYYNEEAENYPPHWHPSFEVIMPVINDYRVVCGHNDYLIKEGEILVICPCMLHELFAPDTGERIIFQPGLNHIKLKELDLITPLLSPAILVTKEEYPQVYEHIHRLMLEIKDEYMNFTTYSEISSLQNSWKSLCILAEITKLFISRTETVIFTIRKNIWRNFCLSPIISATTFLKTLLWRRLPVWQGSANITLPAFLNNILIPPSTNF